jgi:hypothetical protein
MIVCCVCVINTYSMYLTTVLLAPSIYLKGLGHQMDIFFGRPIKLNQYCTVYRRKHKWFFKFLACPVH